MIWFHSIILVIIDTYPDWGTSGGRLHCFAGGSRWLSGGASPTEVAPLSPDNYHRVMLGLTGLEMHEQYTYYYMYISVYIGMQIETL